MLLAYWTMPRVTQSLLAKMTDRSYHSLTCPLVVIEVDRQRANSEHTATELDRNSTALLFRIKELLLARLDRSPT